MCFHFFQGKGYSGEFTQNMREMKERLEQNPEVVLLKETDDVCAHCPNNQAGQCTSAEQAAGYDGQVLACLEIMPGTKMRWREFAGLVEEKILRSGKREEICGECEWNGLCRLE